MQDYNHTYFRNLKLDFDPFSDKYVFPESQTQRAKYTDHIDNRELINPKLIDWAKSIGLGVTRIERFSSNPNYRMYIHTDNQDWIDNLIKIIWCYCPTNDHRMTWYTLKDESWYEVITNNDSGGTMMFPDFNCVEEVSTTIMPNSPILANTGQPHNIENGKSYRHVVCAWFHELKNPMVDLQWDNAVEYMKEFII